MLLTKLYYISQKKLRGKPKKGGNKVKKVVDLCFFLYNSLYKYLESCYIQRDYMYLYLNNREGSLYFVSYFLKNSILLSCHQLLDMTIVDRLEKGINRKKRFEYLYVFLSTNYDIRIILKGFVSMFESLPSLVSLYASANWLEREAWDLFGVFFDNHPNLRRILTDYSFFGYPFRKDFPLTGFFEHRYDGITKTIVIEPLELSQEYRFFNVQMPWRKI